MKQRPIFQHLCERLSEPRRFIQVLLGPRQVGKTTLALQLAEELGRPCHYATADLATLQDLSWLGQQWEVGRSLGKSGLLIIDEIQKIPDWSSMIKKLWDTDTRKQIDLSVVLLGSSPWLMQKGLTESLAGRFEITPITHWSYEEMESTFGWSIDQFIYFGGYPGAAPLAGDEERWMNYINDSLIETTLSRDILLMTQVNKPALLRRLFQLGCTYSGQILSYQKIVGQLQDAGNTTTIAHYLDLLAGAGLLCGLQKYVSETVRRRGSSPKLAVYNTALMSAQSGKSLQEAQSDRPFWGRLVESAVGAHLLNGIRGTAIELSYWRYRNRELDFVLSKGGQKIALEVKTNHEGIERTAVDEFSRQFGPSKILLIGEEGIPLKSFLATPVGELFS